MKVEKRSSVRKSYDGSCAIKSAGTNYMLGKLVNISSGGLMIVGDKSLAINHLYQCQLEFDDKLLTVGLDCLWCESVSPLNVVYSGFKIIDIADDDLGYIEGLLH